MRKKKKSPGGKRPKSGSLARRRPPRPRPIWMQLGPPTWLQNTPPIWIRVIFVRSMGKTVQMRIQQKGAKKPTTISLALSRTKKRLKKSR